MPTHSVTTKPTRFERPQLSGFWRAKRDGLGTSSPRTQTRNLCASAELPECAPIAAQWAPQNLSTLLSLDLLLGKLLQNFTFSRIHDGLVPDLGLSTIDLDSCMSPQLCLQNTISFDDSRRRAQDVNVIQKREQLFARAMLPKGEQQRHKGITLLPTLPLVNRMHNVVLVLPNVCAQLSEEDSHEWNRLSIHLPETLQHCHSRDGVVCTYPID